MNADELIKKRFEELAKRAYTDNFYTFTNFLNQADLNTFNNIKKDLSYAGISLYSEDNDLDLERDIIRFGNEKDYGYSIDYPVTCLEISPLLKKFSSDLTHRDFLGAIMNLGIKREMIGDIKVDDKTAYIFCMDVVAEFIKDNLTRVKNTVVKTNVSKDTIKSFKPQYKEYLDTVSSLRADIIIAAIFKLSRKDTLEFFSEKKIMLNGTVLENNSRVLKPKDKVSVRGKGKFVFNENDYVTKKGKSHINVSLYV